MDIVSRLPTRNEGDSANAGEQMTIYVYGTWQNAEEAEVEEATAEGGRHRGGAAAEAEAAEAATEMLQRWLK